MAVDEALLDLAVQAGTISLRFYQWQQPTLSLGYFQQLAERLSHPSSHHLQAVRRLTGGGAILHDREITYTIAIPSAHPVSRSHRDLYQIVHTSLIEALRDFGISAWQYRGPCCTQQARVQTPPVGTTADATTNGQSMEQREIPPPNGSSQPFLCFQRRCHGDLLMEEPMARKIPSRPAVKIGGSAQRRRRGALLQHGSVLLGSSPASPELPGISELSGLRLQFSDILAAWSPLLAARLDLGLKTQIRSDLALGGAIRQFQTRYAGASWTGRR
jgi:lipoyl(octanoyl) transferase